MEVRNSTTLFQVVPSPTPMASPSSKLGVCNLATPSYLRNRWSYTEFKFGGYIYRANPNKSPLKSFGENGAWAYPGTTQIFWVPPIISERGKATDFKFGGYIYRANPNKSPLKILEKWERGRNQGVPKIFRAPMYKAHCAVIFAIAQLSRFRFLLDHITETTPPEFFTVRGECCSPSIYI